MRAPRKFWTIAALWIPILTLAPRLASSGESLTIHEWGTFTSFQDRDGATIGGINVDDEPVPAFVHRFEGMQILRARSRPARWSQGAPRCHADVTLRLETPVLYFYPDERFDTTQPFSVRASFPSGWLTEFFPAASAQAPGFPGELNESVRGDIAWKDLRLATRDAVRLPDTQEHVWLAPREVHSVVVSTGGEAEKYLFYRGVGHLDAPLMVREAGTTVTVSLRPGSLAHLPPSWLVRVLPDGRVWFKSLKPTSAHDLSMKANYPGDEATSGTMLGELQKSLHAGLVHEGLYADEAAAMLATWKLSYFASEGMRLFFVLPREWTDAHLPLSISAPADITRVMLGRIELMSPSQESALANLMTLPAATIELPAIYPVGHDIPEALRLYDSLGRFRDALVKHELQRAPNAAARERLALLMATFSACESEN